MNRFFVLSILFFSLGIQSSNASVFYATSTNNSVSSFSFEWIDSNMDLIVQNSEVSTPINLPKFSGVEFLYADIAFDQLDEIPNITGGTDGFSQNNQWSFSGKNGSGGAASINNYTYKSSSVDRLTDFNGTVTPITVMLNGVPHSTGDITITLDSTLESTLEIVRDNMVYYVTQNLNLIINSPLMTSLGIENLPINIIETGISPDGMNFDLAGGGMVGGVSPFSGATYLSANNHYEHQPLIIIGKDHVEVGWRWVFGSTATVQLPDLLGNTPQAVTDVGTMEVRTVPEPSTVFLYVIGLIGIKLRESRRMR